MAAVQDRLCSYRDSVMRKAPITRVLLLAALALGLALAGTTAALAAGRDNAPAPTTPTTTTAMPVTHTTTVPVWDGSTTVTPATPVTHTTTAPDGTITTVDRYWNGATITTVVTKTDGWSTTTTTTNGIIAPSYASAGLIPLRGCMGSAGISGSGPCPPMPGVSLWLSKPAPLVKRGTIMTFRARVIDPSKPFAPVLRLVKGGLCGNNVAMIEPLASRKTTASLALVWKAKMPGRYTIILEDGNLKGDHADVYAASQFVVR